MLVLGLINLFVFSVLAEAIIGLVVGVLYVIIDTQMIIHRAENGVFEVFSDAKELFVDFVKIFLEVLKLFSNKKKRDD